MFPCRFGDGYTVIIRVSGQEPDLQPLMSFIETTFPSAELKEKHHSMLQYQLGSSNLCLAWAFGQLEAIRDEYNIEDYSISQTTLDQVRKSPWTVGRNELTFKVYNRVLIIITIKFLFRCLLTLPSNKQNFEMMKWRRQKWRHRHRQHHSTVARVLKPTTLRSAILAVSFIIVN